MNLKCIKNYSLALASAFAMLLVGCNTTNQPEQVTNNNKPSTPTPSVLAAPPVQYDFYRPTTEEALRRDTRYGYLIAKTLPGFRESRFEEYGFKVIGRMSVNGVEYFRLHKESDVLDSMLQSKVMVGLISIEPEEMLYTTDAGWNGNYNNPDPRALAEQYSLYTTQLLDAWKAHGFGPNRPVVAAIDSGVNFRHEDFQDGERNVVRHAFTWYQDNGTTLLYSSTNTPMISDPEPVERINHATITSTDGNGHGTHTAGTIAAVGNNGKGVAGVCWQTDLISYKGASDGGSGGTWELYGSLWHLVKWKKANYPDKTMAVNISMGGSNANTFAIDMVELCLANNIILVVSAGNDGKAINKYPAAYSGVVAVGGTTGTDKLAIFSTRGHHVSVVAPSNNVISLGINGTDHYASSSGTSMSAPFVTGLVTYMLTFDPYMKPDVIKTYLENNADFIDGKTGFTPEYGWGRVNVLKTIGAVVKDIKDGTTPKSNYVNARVKLTVANVKDDVVMPIPGVAVNLYQCDETGEVISNYVSGTVSLSNSFATWDGESETEAGVAFFNILRPGYYKAYAYNTMFDPTTGTIHPEKLGSTPVFRIEPNASSGMNAVGNAGGNTLEFFVAFDRKVLLVQTRPTVATNNADSVIRLYNAAGTMVLEVDQGARGIPENMFVIPPVIGETENWWVSVHAFNIILLAPGSGDYALSATLTKPLTGVAPYTFANAIANAQVRSLQQTARNATNQQLPLDTVIYGQSNGTFGNGPIHYFRLKLD